MQNKKTNLEVHRRNVFNSNLHEIVRRTVQLTSHLARMHC